MKTVYRLLVVWFFASATTKAHTPIPELPLWHVGPTGGILLSTHLGVSYPESSVESEQKLGFAIGIGLGYDLSKLLQLNARLEYQSSPGRFSSTSNSLILLPNQMEPISDGTVTTTDISAFSSLGLSLGVAVIPKLTRQLSAMVSVGPSFRHITEATYSRYADFQPMMRPTNPNGLETENNGQRLILWRDEAIADVNSLQVGLTSGLGIQYQYGTTQIIPAIWYEHSLTNVTSRPEDDGWRVHSLAFRVDCRVGL